MEGAPTHDKSPTREAYDELERAFAFFNAELFDGRLPPCMITLQRQHDTQGYFSPDQFVRRDGRPAHEIALNPSYFAIRPIPETLSVLAREMVSLDQYLHGEKRSRRRYRNKEWATMAEAIGLMPSDTGKPGGKRTGDNVQVYIVDGGLFDEACSRLVDEKFVLSWMDRFPPAEEMQGNEDGLAVPWQADNGCAAEDETPISGGEGVDTALITLEQIDALPALESLSAEEDAGEGGLCSTGLVIDEILDAPQAHDAPLVDSAPAMKRYEPIAVAELAEIGVKPKEQAKSSSKNKFTCPDCGANAWGRSALRLHCAGTDGSSHELVAMVLVAKDAGNE